MQKQRVWAAVNEIAASLLAMTKDKNPCNNKFVMYCAHCI